jgi:hypothetical protein
MENLFMKAQNRPATFSNLRHGELPDLRADSLSAVEVLERVA